MVLKVEILGIDTLPPAFNQLTDSMRRSLRSGMARATVTLENWIKFMKLSGQVLGTSSNWRLKRSIHSRITDTPDAVEGKTGTNVRYAGVHEFGGTYSIPEHLRMVTMVWGRRLENPVQSRVRQHNATFKERSFMRSSYREKAPEILEIFKQAVAEGARG